MAFYQRQSPMCRFAGGARRGSTLEASSCHKMNMCGGKEPFFALVTKFD